MKLMNWPLALILITITALNDRLYAADPPNYPLEPTVLEYDVDPSWPKRPDNVAKWGWVSGMAIDRQDQIWLFNKGEDPVQVYSASGQFVRTWGKGRFNQPHQLRIDYEGNVWVADFGHHVVEKYTPEGELLLTLGIKGEAGEDERHFKMPTDMTITPAGDIFVSDGYGNRRIVHFDKTGQFKHTWGGYGTTPGRFVVPHAIAHDSQGKLYVADRNSGRIQIFDQAGNVVDVWDNVIMPWGLSINAKDEIWVCGSSPHWWYRDGKYQEYKDQILMRFSTDGRTRQVFTIPLGKQGEQVPGETIGAHCITQDSEGNLYVGDIYTERAQKFIPSTKRVAAPAPAPKPAE